jgi:hypothetical protein
VGSAIKVTTGFSCFLRKMLTRCFIRTTGAGKFGMKSNVDWKMKLLSFLEILSTIQNNLPGRVI